MWHVTWPDSMLLIVCESYGSYSPLSVTWVDLAWYTRSVDCNVVSLHWIDYVERFHEAASRPQHDFCALVSLHPPFRLAFNYDGLEHTRLLSCDHTTSCRCYSSETHGRRWPCSEQCPAQFGEILCGMQYNDGGALLWWTHALVYVRNRSFSWVDLPS